MSMARRARASGTSWWAIATLVAVVALALWWLSARRAEAPAPPPMQTGEPVLQQPPVAGHDEITSDEKAELQRIIQQRGQASP